MNKEAGRYFLTLRDVASATRHYEKAVELMDTDFHSWAMLTTCYRASGDTDKLPAVAKKMVSEAQAAVQQDPSNGAALGILAGGYAILGEKEKTKEWIDRALLVDPDNLNMRYNFACILAGYLGDTDAALKMLVPTLAIGNEYVVRSADTDPDLDPIRDDPRFQKSLAAAKKRVGITDSSPAMTP